MNQNGSGTFNVWAGTHFTNAGTLNLVTANWVTNGTFTNSGTIDIPAGRLLTFASTTNLNTGTSFTGTGSITSGATTNQNFSWTNNTHALTISGGTWNNNSGIVLAFAPGGAFNWTAGALSGNSDYSIAAWLTVTLSTPSTKTLNRPLTNNGTVNWSEGVINGTGNIQNTNGAVFNIQFVTTNQLQVPFTNQLGGTVNQNGSGTFNVWSGTNFTNAGTLNLVSANWVTNGAFTNSGTIDIPAGRLLTFSSTTNLNAGTTITGAGAITSGGTTIQNFPWINSTHILTVSGGTWNNNSGTMLAFAPGSTFNWSGGTLAGAAGFEIHAGGTIASFSGATKTLNSILTNNGTINWSAGVINGTSAIGNTEGASMNISFSGANQLGVNLYNYGTLTYTGNGTFNTSVIFQNVTPGVLNVNAGQWHFNNLATLHSGTLNTLAGATAQFNFSTSVGGPVNNSGTLAGSISSFTGPTFTNNGSVTLTSLPFAGTATQTLDGTGTINNLTINNANGVTLGGDQTVTGTLTFTNGKLTLGSSNLTLGLAATTSGQAAARYIVADGSGSLRRAINGANVLFPIGTTSSYLPATLSLTSGPQETFGVRVQDGVHSDYSTPGTPDGALVQNEQVERTWVITEQTAGGNQATVQLQWNAADEGSGFGRANSALHAYNGTDWVVLGLLGPASGSGPYTRSASAVAQFREFTVADGESTLAVACEGGVVPGASCDDGDPRRSAMS
ncbi:MAG: hypothetical protein IPJ85_07975 [Flavobacteriales bacterium]|nr:hypothetical protein [Flavobacteriales bacterium]